MINKPKLLVSFAKECLKKGALLKKIKEKEKSSWPLLFVKYCIEQVDNKADQEELRGNVADDEGFAGTFSPSYGHSPVLKSSDSQKIWEKVPKKFRLKKAAPGSLIIWEKKDGGGHISIAIKPLENQRVSVIEGSDKAFGKVARKIRSFGKDKNLTLVGIITPWH